MPRRGYEMVATGDYSPSQPPTAQKPKLSTRNCLVLVVVVAAAIFFLGGFGKSDSDDPRVLDDCEIQSTQAFGSNIEPFEGGPKCYKMAGRAGKKNPMKGGTLTASNWRKCCQICWNKMIDGCYMWTYKDKDGTCLLFATDHAHYSDDDEWVFGEYAGLLRIKPATDPRPIAQSSDDAASPRSIAQTSDYAGPTCSFKHGRLRGTQITNGSFGVANWEHCCTECRTRRQDGCLFWTYADMECELLKTKGLLDKAEGNPEVWQWGKLGGCSHGPYIINMDCYHHLHGLGNQFRRIKVDILYSLAANLTRIETEDCYAVNARYNYADDLPHFFGFGAYDECGIEDLSWSIERGYMTLVDYQLPRYPRGWTDAVIDHIYDPTIKPKKNSFLDVALRTDLRSPNTVFRIFGEQTIVKTWEITQAWLAEKYEASFQDQKREIFIFDGSRPVKFVVHGRRGDRYAHRRLTEEYYIDVTSKAFDAVPELHQVASIFLFSDGLVEEWSGFTAKFPNTTLSALDSPEAESYPKYAKDHMSQTALDHMSHADILVTSKSTFSNLAGSLNTHSIKLAIEHKDFDFHGVPNIINVEEKHARFDVKQFQKAYITLKKQIEEKLGHKIA